jgi:hypothetical protein
MHVMQEKIYDDDMVMKTDLRIATKYAQMHGWHLFF